jgi:hypothetical protein
MIDKLLQLAKIFKTGFTVELIGGEICQYGHYDKPYIVSYLTLIEIRPDKVIYNNIQHIPTNCIIGGWLDVNTDTYYIELNNAFKDKATAMVFAQSMNQGFIYNSRNGKQVRVR